MSVKIEMRQILILVTLHNVVRKTTSFTCICSWFNCHSFVILLGTKNACKTAGQFSHCFKTQIVGFRLKIIISIGYLYKLQIVRLRTPSTENDTNCLLLTILLVSELSRTSYSITLFKSFHSFAVIL